VSFKLYSVNRISRLKTLSRVYKNKSILLLVFLSIVLNLSAMINQNIENADSLYLGSRFYLNIQSDAELKDVIAPDTLTRFVIVDKQKLTETGKPSGIKLTIAALDTGEHTFPSLIVKTVKPSADTLKTRPFTLTIHEIRAPGDSALVDIAETQKLKGELPYWAYYFIAAFLVAALITTIILLILKYRKMRQAMMTRPTVQIETGPNWKRALDALYKLKEMRLPEKGLFIQYHFRLSEIMKLFLEAEYKFYANEMTTREIKLYIKDNKIFEAKEQAEIVCWFEGCDKVKYAKHIPGLEECAERQDWFFKWLMKQSTRSESSIPEKEYD